MEEFQWRKINKVLIRNIENIIHIVLYLLRGNKQKKHKYVNASYFEVIFN
jgi:hypothetical protein